MPHLKLSKRFKSSFRAIKEWGSSSSFHGIPNIVKTHHALMRLIWIVCFFIALAYFCYSCVISFTSYLAYEADTQISLKNEPSIEFPMVIFCNLQQVKIPQTAEMTSYIQTQHDMVNMSLLNLTTMSIMVGLDYWNKLSALQLNFNESTYASYSHTIDEMLVNCRFNNMRCTKNDFESYYSFGAGNCYKFNSGKFFNGSSYSPLKRASTPGRRNALTLELYSGQPDIFHDLIRSTGVVIFIQNSSYSPITNAEGVFLANGFETDILIKQTYLNKLSSPYSDCIENVKSDSAFESFLYKTTVDSIKTYNQKYCLQLCQQKFVIDTCGCYDATLPQYQYNGMRPCNLTELQICIYPSYPLFYGTKKVSDCFHYCPNECKSVYFDYELSYADFPTPYYADLLLRYNKLYPNPNRVYTTYESIKNSTLAVNIYYDDISYTVLGDSPKTTSEQFFANVGGLLGITIGTSLLMMVELVELAYMTLRSFFKAPILEK